MKRSAEDITVLARALPVGELASKINTAWRGLAPCRFQVRRIARFETDAPIRVNVAQCGAPFLSIADGWWVHDGKAISDGPKILAALDRKRQFFDIDARARFACHRATGRGAGRLLANGGAPCTDFCRGAG